MVDSLNDQYEALKILIQERNDANTNSGTLDEITDAMKDIKKMMDKSKLTPEQRVALIDAMSAETDLEVQKTIRLYFSQENVKEIVKTISKKASMNIALFTITAWMAKTGINPFEWINKAIQIIMGLDVVDA